MILAKFVGVTGETRFGYARTGGVYTVSSAALDTGDWVLCDEFGNEITESSEELVDEPVKKAPVKKSAKKKSK